jgi:hypothetical protein
MSASTANTAVRASTHPAQVATHRHRKVTLGSFALGAALLAATGGALLLQTRTTIDSPTARPELAVTHADPPAQATPLRDGWYVDNQFAFVSVPASVVAARDGVAPAVARPALSLKGDRWFTDLRDARVDRPVRPAKDRWFED